MNNLAGVLRDQGNYEKAEEMYLYCDYYEVVQQGERGGWGKGMRIQNGLPGTKKLAQIWHRERGRDSELDLCLAWCEGRRKQKAAAKER
jgi:hypothetical protein